MLPRKTGRHLSVWNRQDLEPQEHTLHTGGVIGIPLSALSLGSREIRRPAKSSNPARLGAEVDTGHSHPLIVLWRDVGDFVWFICGGGRPIFSAVRIAMLISFAAAYANCHMTKNILEHIVRMDV